MTHHLWRILRLLVCSVAAYELPSADQMGYFRVTLQMVCSHLHLQVILFLIVWSLRAQIIKRKFTQMAANSKLQMQTVCRSEFCLQDLADGMP